MRSLRILVVNEPPQPATNAGRTAVPGRIEAVRSLFERLEPPLDVVAAAILNPTAQSQPGQSGPIAEAIDQQFRLRKVVMLRGTRQERRPQNASRSDVLHESFVLVNAAGSVPRRLNTSISSTSSESNSIAA